MSAKPSPTRFHLSLNVADLGRSIAFYRVLFDREPAKRHDDYAKFDLDDPPLVFSLVPRAPAAGGSLSHIGLRMPDQEAIDRVRRRLEAAGIPVRCPENQCWVSDPDSNSWAIYVSDEDVSAAVPGKEPAAAAPGPRAWEHSLSQPVPERLGHADASLEKVRLVGTFNSSLEESQRLHVVKEAFRVLRPGGKILAHGLAADGPFPAGPPSLPGLAALVARVPVQTEIPEVLRAAGFVGVQFVKLAEQPWIRHDGVGLREVKLIGWKPPRNALDVPCRVLYRGPFAQAVDDAGQTYLRGQWVSVAGATAEVLRQGTAAGQFVFEQGV